MNHPGEHCVVFRPPTLKDLDSVRECHERNLPERYDEPTWTMLLDAHGSSSWVLLGQPLDETSQCRVRGFALASHTHVLALVVDKEYRGQGLGQRLMERVLRNPHMRFPVHLQVRTSNVVARRFWCRLGFVNDHVLPEYYASTSPPEDAMLMRCDRRRPADTEELSSDADSAHEAVGESPFLRRKR